MISDGWGYNHIAATDYYQYGRTGRQVYERFPVRTGMSTYLDGGSYDPSAAWVSFDYVKSGATDSAAASTTMSTGVKTYSGAIGVDPAGADLVHAFQKAEETGRSTGVVTSVQLSHATPAGFVAHNVTRNDYPGIANEMIYDSATDVIMGGGHPCYDANGVPNGCTNTTKYVGGDATWADLTDVDGALGADANGDGSQDPWTLVQARDEFRSLARGKTPQRVIGVPQVYQTLQQSRRCDATEVNPLTGVNACIDAPYRVPVTTSVPTLAEMSKAALNVLDNDRDGFALMIEGGAVDWASHNNAVGRTIEEQADFNRAVTAVVAWINRNGGWRDNLLVVTGDHECGYLTGPSSDPTWTSVVSQGRAAVPLAEFHSTGHTNSLIPLFAKGSGSSLLSRAATEHDPERGRYLDNADLGGVLNQILG
ncbi:MAG: alkaline phosphatase [Dactylosporangium sp.]|nr:alkaline phosphatase [Dactylosporangium sp.]